VKIKSIESQSRRDFTAIYECDHCGHLEKAYGYDDAFFHGTVIPAMKCKECGKSASDNYQPQPTKYPEGMIV
jgi:transcription elongation factor Elf1